MAEPVKRKSVQSNKSLLGVTSASPAHHQDDTHELFEHKSSKKASGFIVNGGEKPDLAQRHSFIMPDLSPSMAAIRDQGKTSVVKAKKKIDPRPNRHKLAPLESYQRQIEYRAEASGRVLVRLERIMGDDRIRVMDRKYLNTFFKGLLADEQKVWRKRSMQRKRAERERFRQLAIAGEMEPSEEMADLYDNPVFRANQALNRLMKMESLPYHENLPPITPVEPFEVYDRTGYLFPEHPGHYKLGGKASYPSPKPSTTMSTRGEEEDGETTERFVHPLKATQTSSMTVADPLKATQKSSMTVADPRSQFSKETVAETDTFLKKYVRESGMIVKEENEDEENEGGDKEDTGEDDGNRGEEQENRGEDEGENDEQGEGEGETYDEGEEGDGEEEEEDTEEAKKVISPNHRTDESFFGGTCDPEIVGQVSFSEAQRRMGIDIEEQIEKTFTPHRSELVGKFVEDEASNAVEMFSYAKDITETYKREQLHTEEEVAHMVKVGGPGYFEINAPPPPPPPPKEREERRTSQPTEQPQPPEERRTFDFSRIEQPDKSASQTSTTEQTSEERRGSQESKKSVERQGSQESKKSVDRGGSQDSASGQKSEERRGSQESTASRQKSEVKRFSLSDTTEAEEQEQEEQEEQEEQDQDQNEDEQGQQEGEEQEPPEEEEQEPTEEEEQEQPEEEAQEQPEENDEQEQEE